MNDPKVKEFLQGYATHKLIAAPQDFQPGSAFEIEVFIRHSWQAMLQPRRQHRRRQRAAEAEKAKHDAGDDDSAASAAADGKEKLLESIELECKAADDADEENFRRMGQQNLTPRPLFFKAKCAYTAAGSSDGVSPPKAEVLSCTARYATDAEMQRAEQEGQVQPSFAPQLFAVAERTRDHPADGYNHKRS